MGHQLAVADFPMETSKRFYRRHPNEQKQVQQSKLNPWPSAFETRTRPAKKAS
jgi:hypothetical protein